jgi:hypothetical protein
MDAWRPNWKQLIAAQRLQTAFRFSLEISRKKPGADEPYAAGDQDAEWGVSPG